jgi:flagellar assembly protein FliH
MQRSTLGGKQRMNPWRQSIRLSHLLHSLRLGQAPAEPDGPALAEKLRVRYEEGLRDGEKRLREQLLQQRAELMELQNGLFQSLRQCLPQVRTECEGALVELALEVARRLVAGMPISAETIAFAVREALNHIEAGQDMVVLLHAEDLGLLEKANDPMLLTTIGGEKIRFQASPELTRGGCLVQTRFGTMDARRETKFELLKQSLVNQ